VEKVETWRNLLFCFYTFLPGRRKIYLSSVSSRSCQEEEEKIFFFSFFSFSGKKRSVEQKWFLSTPSTLLHFYTCP
jgi:hypothetical protein